MDRKFSPPSPRRGTYRDRISRNLDDEPRRRRYQRMKLGSLSQSVQAQHPTEPYPPYARCLAGYAHWEVSSRRRTDDGTISYLAQNFRCSAASATLLCVCMGGETWASRGLSFDMPLNLWWVLSGFSDPVTKFLGNFFWIFGLNFDESCIFCQVELVESFALLGTWHPAKPRCSLCLSVAPTDPPLLSDHQLRCSLDSLLKPIAPELQLLSPPPLLLQ